VGARFSAPIQTGPGSHPASCAMGTGSFLAVKSGRGVTLTPHPLLVPWSRKFRAIPLLPLWAVRPVQSLSACTRVHFSFKTVLSLDIALTWATTPSFQDFDNSSFSTPPYNPRLLNLPAEVPCTKADEQTIIASPWQVTIATERLSSK